MGGGHPDHRVGHRQQVRAIGGPVRPSVVLLDHLGALVRGVGGQRGGRLAAEVVLRVADRHPGHPGRVRRGRRVGGPSSQRRVDDLATLAVTEQGDRAAVVRLRGDVLDEAVGAHLVELLTERQRQIVHGLAGVRRIAQLAAQLHLGEGDDVLQSDDAALEGEDGPGQALRQRRQPDLGGRGGEVRRRRCPEEGGRQPHRQTGPQQRVHITLRCCSANFSFLPQQILHAGLYHLELPIRELQ